MLEKGKISTAEFQTLVIVFIIGGSILTAPGQLISIAKQDAWIASIISILLTLAYITFLKKLANLYPDLNYIELNEKILGKWLGKLSSLSFLFYFLYLAAGSLREIGNFFTTQILVETPIEAIMILLTVTSLIGVRLGLEVLCRTVIIFIPWISLLLFLLFIFLIPQIKIENMQPIFENGIKPILNGVYSDIALPYLQIVMFLMIIPYLNRRDQLHKSFTIGVVIGGVTLTIVILLCIYVLGVDITARQTYPAYILGKKIAIGNFLERIEAIVAIIWMMTMFFKITLIYYVLSLGLATVFGTKEHRIFHFPLAFLIYAYAIIIHPDIVHFQYFIQKAWTPYTMTICVLLPLSLFIVGKIKVKRAST